MHEVAANPPSTAELIELFRGTYGPDRALPTPAELISDDLVATIEAAMSTGFATTFGYYFAGMRSKPPAGQLLTAGEDAVFFSTADDAVSVLAYFQAAFSDVLAAQDAITFASQLAAVVQKTIASHAQAACSVPVRLRNGVADCYLATSTPTAAGTMLFVYGYVVHT